MSARVLRAALVLLAIVAVGVASTRTNRLFDLTADRTLTLTEQTTGVLARLRTDVEITAFVRRNEAGRVQAVALLDRYRSANRRVTWKVVDPDDAPGEVARLGIDPIFGGVAVVAGDKIERVPAVTEQDLTSAVARLVRARVDEVCFTTGHGETALRQARALLEREGYRTRDADLLARAEIPASCNAVVLASPTAPLVAAATTALRNWVEADGKLFVLVDPAAPAAVDLAAVLRPFGLAVERGVVFEGDGESVIGGDVTAPVVRTYSSSHPVVRRLAPTYFPGVQGIAVDEAAERRVPGLTVSRLADTSAASYLETAPVAAQFDPASDGVGPVTVAAAADRSRNDGERIARTRLVVVGDVDFASDQFLGNAGNAALFGRAVAWLTLGEDVAAISAHLPADRPLRFTDARLTYARLVTAGLIPTLFVLAGAMVWAARRSR